VGENLKTVQELLGHADISTTAKTYSHVSAEVKRKAIVKLDGLLTKKTLPTEQEGELLNNIIALNQT